MKKLVFLAIFLICATCQYAHAQAPECPSPNGCVTITREAAIQAVEDKRVRAALEKEVAAKDEAIKKHEQIEQDLLVKLAEKSGENTALKQNDVSNRAIITAMIPMLRQKVVGIKIF